MLVGLLLAVVMVGAVFVPVVSSSTSRTITTEIENEGAGWLALGYNEGTDYSFTVGFETVTVEEVETEIFKVGNQTGDYEDMICYADPQRTLFVSGDYWYLLTNGESPSVYKFTENASVTNASGTLTILDGSDTIYTGASPTWAYVPDANGVYGFFTDGGLNLEEGKPTVAVGSYAGVFAYNDTVVAPYGYGDLGLTMSGNYADGEVIWAVAPSELDTLSTLPTDTLEPAVLDLDPISIQPIDLGGSGSVGLMSVPTPTYTDGDWGWDSVSGGAKIVSYSGAGGDIVVPSTVTRNGNVYTVLEFGKGTSAATVFDNSALPSENTITFPDTLVKINQFAMYDCKKFVGSLIIPDSVTTLGTACFEHTNFDYLKLGAGVTSIPGRAFNYVPFENDLIIPDTVTSISSLGFNFNLSNWSKSQDCLVIPENMLTLDSDFVNRLVTPSLINLSNATFNSAAFSQYNQIQEVLNLGETEFTTTSYGLSAESVQDHVSALGYIAPTSIHETEVVPIDSPVAGIMQLLPLIAGIGALFLAVGTMIYTRF